MQGATVGVSAKTNDRHSDVIMHHTNSSSDVSVVDLSVFFSFLVLASNPTEAGSSQFALWVAFFEIYNECVYDLLQLSLCSKSKKRASLRVCDDGAGNAYVKGVIMTKNVPVKVHVHRGVF